MGFEPIEGEGDEIWQYLRQHGKCSDLSVSNSRGSHLGIVEDPNEDLYYPKTIR